ncbi:MAG TPA: ABC transporter ATP-binding protein [Thermotogota bacterium]|nr:ABC transporter ATP-binding protein [Thermotogota bacterium]HPF16463.1 ABC transporter ATP-binding protein [Thermotogota bacterium]HRW34451.1 ABC transporter ATP-binding protein [Thermotogota bacterium]
MHTIQINHITKRYDDQLALDNVSLEIKPGEIFGLLGPNGAGKTTLIHILCGLIPMDNGEVTIGGISVKKDPETIKNRIGFVPQEIVLFDNLSVNDNLDYFGRLYGLRGAHLKERIAEALKIAVLSDRRKSKVKKLSGGMKRRLNLACAIMHQPDILVLDEPTLGVDPQSRHHILESVRQMNADRQMTVVYTSHYMEEVEALCDRLMILDLGRELVSGTKTQILRTITNESTMRIGSEAIPPEMAALMSEIKGVKRVNIQGDLLEIFFGDNCEEQIMHELLKSKVRIKTITMEEPNLETVFLSITGKALRD